MNQVILESTLILVAGLFFVAGNLAQLIRLIKTRDRKGLSAPNQALNASGNVAWIVYFITQHHALPVITNALMCITLIATLGFTLANKVIFIRSIAAVIFIGGGIAAAIITLPAYAGWIGVACNTIAMMPWIIRIIYTKKTSGLSERALYLGTGAILCSAAYAVLIESTPLLVGNLLGLIGNGIALRYCYTYRYRS
ncbi:hypothetical protein E6P97_02385 [Patescibacteria group bacterium]|jgi:uncharacterized protein with PQ loop repeat|nr:MAG: hypothetical protein E6P97_02385 [Patescibacteria group bacterium]